MNLGRPLRAALHPKSSPPFRCRWLVDGSARGLIRDLDDSEAGNAHDTKTLIIGEEVYRADDTKVR